MPPGIRESNERPGLKPARLQILQNGTTKKIVDAISHCSIANSLIIPPSRTERELVATGCHHFSLGLRPYLFRAPRFPG